MSLYNCDGANITLSSNKVGRLSERRNKLAQNIRYAGKKLSWPISVYYSRNYLEGLRRNETNISQTSRLRLEVVISGYEIGLLTTIGQLL